jgi:hypothetical protein
VRSCDQLLQRSHGLWTFLELQGVEPTNNIAVDAVFSAGVRALCQLVIQRKIRDLPSNSRCVQPWDIWQFLEEVWISHHCGGVMTSSLHDP